MTYSVQFVGLACFLKAPGERHVMLPDGRNPGNDIEPHFASIFVDADAVETSNGWNQEAEAYGEFPLAPCAITIGGVNAAGALDTADHDSRLPQLCRIDPNFSIDRDTTETIATIDVRNGKLTGYRIPGGTAVITDVGMTGSRTSVLGVKPEQALASLITQMPVRFETAEDDVWVMGAAVEINPSGRADSIEQVLVPAPPG